MSHVGCLRQCIAMSYRKLCRAFRELKAMEQCFCERWIMSYFLLLFFIVSMAFRTPNVYLICDNAKIATWHHKELPNDWMSTENAIISAKAIRWLWIIDPQLNMHTSKAERIGNIEDWAIFCVTILGKESCILKIGMAIAMDRMVSMENINGMIDAVLNPLLSRHNQWKCWF